MDEDPLAIANKYIEELCSSPSTRGARLNPALYANAARCLGQYVAVRLQDTAIAKLKRNAVSPQNLSKNFSC